MTSVSTGKAGMKRSAHDHRSSADVLPPRPIPPTGDDGLRSLGALLLEYACLCQQDDASDDGPGVGREGEDCGQGDAHARRGADGERAAEQHPRTARARPRHRAGRHQALGPGQEPGEREAQHDEHEPRHL